MKVKDGKLVVKLDLDLSAEQISRFFCMEYHHLYEDPEHLQDIATRLNKTEILKATKNIMINNIWSGYQHENCWASKEMIDIVLPIIKRKFDGIL